MKANTLPDKILDAAADTFRQRNAVYGDNYLHFGDVLAPMFPHGVVLRTPEEFNRFALFLNCVMKISRYATNLDTGGHEDSAHDLSVYAAMLESITCQKS